MTSESFQEPTGPQTAPTPYQGPYVEYRADGPATGPQMPSPTYSGSFAWGDNQAANAAPVSVWDAIKQLPRQYWRILRYPGSATFAQEMGKARWDIIWVQVIGLSLLNALFVMLILFIEFAFLSAIFASMPTPSGGESFPSDFTGLFFLPIPIFGTIALISGIGSYFLGEGITYALAKAFGGQGGFKTQMYCSLLYRAPIAIVSVLLALVPLVGSIASLGSIYAYVLQTFQMMAVHRLSTGKAIAVVLIPVGVGLLLAFMGVALYFYFIFNTIHTMSPTP